MQPRVIIFLVTALFATSCSPLAPLPGHNKFFMLTPIAEDGGAGTRTAPAQQISIGVGPIDFPDYLRRPEVVTRTAPTRIDVSQENRWAGQLDRNFNRVLSANLAAILNTDRVENYPWSRVTPVDYQVMVDVERFDTGADKQARLNARWSIRDGRNEKILYAGESRINAPVGSGEEGPSTALSSNVEALSRDIASQLTLLNQQRLRGISQR